LLLVLNLALPLFIPNVAWQAHLGGGLVGIIVVGLWHQLKPSPRINTVRSAISYGVGVLAMVMVLLA
jgi:membrane associated rhomboid family serine protease